VPRRPGLRIRRDRLGGRLVKARRRVVTNGGAPAKRRPTVRRIKSAILPATRRIAQVAPAAPVASSGNGAGSSATAERRTGAAAPTSPEREIDLSVDLGRGLRLANPILVASGTFGYGVEYGDVVDVQRLGAICCKG